MNFLLVIVLLISAITYYIEVKDGNQLFFNIIYFIITTFLFITMVVINIVTL